MTGTPRQALPSDQTTPGRAATSDPHPPVRDRSAGKPSRALRPPTPSRRRAPRSWSVRDRLPAPDRATHAGHRRRLRNGLIVAAVLSVIAGALVLAVPGLRSTAHHRAHVNAWWIALGVALELISCLGYVLAFALVFDTPPRGFGARVAWAELAFGAIVPVGGAGGIALGGWMLHQRA